MSSRLIVAVVSLALIGMIGIQFGLGATPVVKVNVYQRYTSAGPHARSKSSPTYLTPRTAMDFVNASMDVSGITLPDHEIWDEQDTENGILDTYMNCTSFSFYCPYNCTLDNVSIRFFHSGPTRSVLIRLYASQYNDQNKLIPGKWQRDLDSIWLDSSGWYDLTALNTGLLTNNTNASTWFIMVLNLIDDAIISMYYVKDDTTGDNLDEHIVCYRDLTEMKYKILTIDGSTIDVQAKVGLKPLDSTPSPSECNLKINDIPVEDGTGNAGSWFTDTMPPTVDEYYQYTTSADWFDYSLNIGNVKQYHKKMNLAEGQLTAVKEWGVVTGWKHEITLGIFSSQCGSYLVEYEIPSSMETPLVFRGGAYQAATYSTAGGVTKVVVAGADGHYVLTFDDPVSAAALPMVKIGVFAGIGGGVAVVAVILIAKMKKKSLKPYLE